MIKRRLSILLAAGLLYVAPAFSCDSYFSIDNVEVDQDENVEWVVTLHPFNPTDGEIASFISCLNSLPSSGMKSVIVRNPVDRTIREYNQWPLVLGDEANPCEECYDDENI